jgi:hypothetical protein
MTEADKVAAIDADRVRQDPAFQKAVLAIRKKAMEALILVEPTNTDEIRTLQARVWAIDNLCTELAATILRGTPQRQNPVV